MPRVCAVVVTYFPAQSVVENVRLLAAQTDEVMVVDNGTEGAGVEYLKRLQGMQKVTVILNGKNLGIAAALNIGARYAIERNYPWLATFDQDSRVPADYIRNILAGRNAIEVNEGPVILAPVYFDEATNQTWSGEKGNGLAGGCRETDAVITSGSVMSTGLFGEVGFFDEGLFIDYVDFDFCLRCRQKGYKIIQLPHVVLNHNLGRKTTHGALGRNIVTSNHGPVRRYYITRNRLIVYGRYLHILPHWVLRDIVLFIKEGIKILAFEERKSAKFMMMFLGAWHALINRRGPLPE